MKSWMLEQALGLVMPVLVGFLTPVAMTALKTVSSRVSILPDTAQRLVVVMIAGLGNAAATLLAVQVTGDPLQWNATEMNAVLSAAMAFALHASNRNKSNAAQIAAVKADGLRALDRGESPFKIP
jgi:hypothetical protein